MSFMRIFSGRFRLAPISNSRNGLAHEFLCHEYFESSLHTVAMPVICKDLPDNVGFWWSWWNRRRRRAVSQSDLRIETERQPGRWERLRKECN